MKRFVRPMIALTALMLAVFILVSVVPSAVPHPEYDQGCACMNGGIAVYVDDESWRLSDRFFKSVNSGESYSLHVVTDGRQNAEVIPATMTWMPNMADNAKFAFDPQEVADNSVSDESPIDGVVAALFTVTAPRESGLYLTALSFQGAVLEVSVSVGTAATSATASTASTTPVPIDTSALTEEEKNQLSYLYEEDKLARDLYLYLGNKWNNQLLKDIATGSEQKHMDALKALADNHGVPLPDNGPGVFANSDLQKLYSQLAQQGSVSLVEAFKAAVLAEETDIHDLQQGIATTNHGDLKTVYGDLVHASSIHLTAFQHELSKYPTTTSVPQESGGILTNGTIAVIIVAVSFIALAGALFLRRRK
jgi:hypothetical protein